MVASLALVAGAVQTDREPRPAERVSPRGTAPEAALTDERADVTRTTRARPNRTAVLPPAHTVQPGDTLVEVGERYGVAASALAQANAVDGHATLHPGQTLVIPRSGSPRPATPAEALAAGLAVEGLLTQTAADFGLDAALVQAVAWRESRWQQRVVSHREAIGIMQVRPATGAAMAGHLGREINLYDVTDNVLAGTAYLALLLDRSSGDLGAALAAYNQGPQSLAERGRLPVTQQYVADVMALRGRFAQAHAAR